MPASQKLRKTKELFQIKGDEETWKPNAIQDLRSSFVVKDIRETSGKICEEGQ